MRSKKHIDTKYKFLNGKAGLEYLKSSYRLITNLANN